MLWLFLVVLGMSRLLTIAEAAAALAVKPATLRAWRLRRKHLDFVQVGRSVRVPAESVEKFIVANTVPAREVRQ